MPILYDPAVDVVGYVIPGGPPLLDGQIGWGDALLGAGTVLELDSIDGWEDLPDISDASALRPTSAGAWAGRLLPAGRTITATFVLNVDLPDHRPLAAAARDLFQLAQAEAPLVVNLGGLQLQCSARVTRRTVKVDRLFSMGGGAVVVQWQASDPRRYDTVQQSQSCGLPQRGAGISFPLAFPLAFGDTASSGSLSASVGGSVATPPQLTITGPCADPVVVNQTTGQTLRLGIGLTLAAGDVLSVDTREGLVLLNGQANRTGSVSDDSVLVEDFLLSPGSNVLAFRADVMDSTTAAARLTVAWRDAVL